MKDKIKIETKGIYGISEAEYHADPCVTPSLSNSIAKLIENRSPYHAWLEHPRLNPDHEPINRKIFDMGSAAHNLLLDPENDKIVVLDFDNFRTKVAQTARNEVYFEGKTPILKADFEKIEDMRDVAIEFIETSELKDVFLNGLGEQAMVWQEKNGVWCRGLADWITNDHKIILDYKTTTNADPETFILKHIIQQGYDMQGAHYLSGMYEITGVNPTFVFLVQENIHPYSCSLVSLSEPFLEIGRAKIDRAIEVWKNCLESGKWGGYDSTIHYAFPPQWALMEHEEKLDE